MDLKKNNVFLFYTFIVSFTAYALVQTISKGVDYVADQRETYPVFLWIEIDLFLFFIIFAVISTMFLTKRMRD